MSLSVEAKRESLVKRLVGSGDKVMLTAAPFLVIGLVVNSLRPAWFAVGGPAAWLRILSIVLLAPGVVLWLWSAALVLTHVPAGKLITGGPFRLVAHPLYTSVGLLVLPWVGFLLNSWLGLVVGLALYVGARRFAPEEDRALSTQFGAAWRAYRERVLLKGV